MRFISHFQLQRGCDAMSADGNLATSESKPNWRRGFWSLIATQFQGAFNENALKFLIIYLALALEKDKAQRDQLEFLVGVLFAAPFILFSLSGGYLADRFRKRSVTLSTKVFEIGVSLLAVVSLADPNFPLPRPAIFVARWVVSDEADSRRSHLVARGAGKHILFFRRRAAAVQYFSVRARRSSSGFHARRPAASGGGDRHRCRQPGGGIAIGRENRVRAYSARRPGHDHSGCLSCDSGTFLSGRAVAPRGPRIRRRILHRADQRADPAHSGGGAQRRSSGRGKLAFVRWGRCRVGRILRHVSPGASHPRRDFFVGVHSHAGGDGLRAVLAAGFAASVAALGGDSHAVPAGRCRPRQSSRKGRRAAGAESRGHGGGNVSDRGAGPAGALSEVPTTLPPSPVGTCCQTDAGISHSLRD